MITALLLGIVLGFTLSIPPGPLAVAVSKKGLEGHFLPAFMTGLGAALMDVGYNLIAAFASSAIVVSLSSLFLHNRWLSVFFQAMSVVVLFVLGLRYILQKQDAATDKKMVEQEEAQEQKAKKLGHGSPFFVGVLIAFTSLPSPTFMPSIIAAVSYLHAEGFLQNSVGTNILYAVGFGIGTLLWFIIIIRFLLRQRTKLSPHFVTNIYRFAGGTFILFALALVYNIAANTNWTTLF